MGAATANGDSLDSTIAAIAALSGTAKYLYDVLHIPFLTIRLNIGAYTGPLVFNPLVQHLLYGRVQGGDIVKSQTVRTACRMEAGVEKSLVGIDIANAGDHRLIQQEWF